MHFIYQFSLKTPLWRIYVSSVDLTIDCTADDINWHSANKCCRYQWPWNEIEIKSIHVQEFIRNYSTLCLFYIVTGFIKNKIVKQIFYTGYTDLFYQYVNKTAQNNLTKISSIKSTCVQYSNKRWRKSLEGHHL